MVDLHEWVDVKQDPDFFRTVDLDNWEYAIMRALSDGVISVDKMYGVISSLIVKPKSADYELTDEQSINYISDTLVSIKERGLVKVEDGWALIQDNSFQDERKRLLELYMNRRSR